MFELVILLIIIVLWRWSLPERTLYNIVIRNRIKFPRLSYNNYRLNFLTVKRFLSGFVILLASSPWKINIDSVNPQHGPDNADLRGYVCRHI